MFCVEFECVVWLERCQTELKLVYETQAWTEPNRIDKLQPKPFKNGFNGSVYAVGFNGFNQAFVDSYMWRIFVVQDVDTIKS